MLFRSQQHKTWARFLRPRSRRQQQTTSSFPVPLHRCASRRPGISPQAPRSRHQPLRRLLPKDQRSPAAALGCVLSALLLTRRPHSAAVSVPTCSIQQRTRGHGDVAATHVPVAATSTPATVASAACAAREGARSQGLIGGQIWQGQILGPCV